MYKENPKTMEEILQYLQYWIKRAGSDMPHTDPDHIIARFMTVCVLDDHPDEFAYNEPFQNIAAQVSDIEIGDGDIYERWEELKRQVKLLEAQLENGEKTTT